MGLSRTLERLERAGVRSVWAACWSADPYAWETEVVFSPKARARGLGEGFLERAAAEVEEALFEAVEGGERTGAGTRFSLVLDLAEGEAPLWREDLCPAYREREEGAVRVRAAFREALAGDPAPPWEAWGTFGDERVRLKGASLRSALPYLEKPRALAEKEALREAARRGGRLKPRRASLERMAFVLRAGEALEGKAVARVRLFVKEERLVPCAKELLFSEPLEAFERRAALGGLKRV